MSEGWIDVTASEPCRVCRGRNWCGYTVGQQHVICCRRHNSSPELGVGVRRIDKAGQPYYLYFQREGGSYPGKSSTVDDRPGYVADTSPNERSDYLEERFAKLRSHFTFTAHDALARELGLPLRHLDRFPGIGWEPGTPSRPGAWCFPEVDGFGVLIGLSYRRGASKYSEAGGFTRGLTVPVGWADRSDPILIVEGASDSLAALDAGLCAIGRSSCRADVSKLAALLKDVAVERDIVFVGENDRNRQTHVKDAVTYRWPGRAGAYYSATLLARLLNRRVWWAMAPDEQKDTRCWFRAQRLTAVMDWTSAGQRYLSALQTQRVVALPSDLHFESGLMEVSRCCPDMSTLLFSGKTGGRLDGQIGRVRASATSGTVPSVEPAT